MPRGDPEAGRCLDSNVAFDFARGRLGAEPRLACDQHLDGCSDCRLLLAEAVRSLREHTPSTAPRQSPALARLAPGVLLAGRYEIVRFLARGGMGEVYEANDRMLGERIALKTVAATIADDPGAVQRLKLEANIARRVTHPNTCRIFDVGVHGQKNAHDVYFITMELVPGVSLRSRLLAAGPMDLHTAVPIVQGMVAGLGAVHRVGLVHRDFKSDNVMLAPVADAPAPRVVVMDFGLARLTTGVSSTQSHERGLVGTIAYMAPEQLRGEPTTRATDVYALGVVMFEMATGRLPFTADSVIGAATRRLVEPAPSARAFAPGVDARWEAVIAHALQRDPAARFVQVEDIADALSGARPVRPRSRPGRTRSRQLSLVVGLVGIGAGAVAVARFGPRSQDPPAPVATERRAVSSSTEAPTLHRSTGAPAGAPVAPQTATPTAGMRKKLDPKTRPRSPARTFPPASPTTIEPPTQDSTAATAPIEAARPDAPAGASEAKPLVPLSRDPDNGLILE